MDGHEAAVLESGTPVLGDVVWLHVRDALVPRDQAKALANQLGVDTSVFPMDTSPVDAFRRATAEAQHRDGNITYMVRKVRDSKGVVVRRVVREERDGANEVLAHHQVYEFRFENDTFHGHPINGGANDPVTDEIASKCRTRYQQLIDHYTGEEMSRAVKRTLDRMSRIMVHPTGVVYFVPHMYHGQLQALRRFVLAMDDFATGAGSADRNVFSVVPLPDVEANRSDVLAGFNRQFAREVAEAMADLADALRGDGRPPAGLLESKAAMVADLQRRFDDYRKALGEQAELVDGGLGMLHEQLEALVDQANVQFTGSKFGEVVLAIPGVEVTELEAYAKIEHRGRLIGRARLHRAGVTCYTDLDVAAVNPDLADRDEWEANKGGGYKVATGEADVFGLFVGALVSGVEAGTIEAKAPAKRGRKPKGAAKTVRSFG